ncbi:MAG: ABC transporter permease, partial [Holophagae bacterium]
MRLSGLRRSVTDDLRRHWRHLAAGGLGVAVSIAALVFFLALGLGLRSVLLGDVFTPNRIEVVPKSTDLNLLALSIELGSDTLDDDDIGKLASLPGVAAVYPKMRLL